MQREKHIQKLLSRWLSSYFLNKTVLLIEEDVLFKVNDFKMSADLIAIQSKSNVIHGFEIKSLIDKQNLIPSIWQTYSYYTNYRWLVIPIENAKIINEVGLEQIQKLGIGIITFDYIINDFRVLREASYVDGNFLKFLPQLESEWLTINKKR